MNTDSPLIFDFAKGSFVDGPGLRTVVFLKGCPLRCPWCQNPESQSQGVETFFYPELCIGCGSCEKGERCFAGARKITGRYYSPPELIEIIMQDRPYYDASGGGVTFSGGEPFLYYGYLGGVLPELKKQDINIAVQTCGYFDEGVYESGILKYIDTVFFDLKVLNPEKHRAYTGVDNGIILDNFLRLKKTGIELTPRVPLIPGFTATKENLEQVSGFLKENNINRCELLPYNTAGLFKWKRLGKEVPHGVSDKPMTHEEEVYFQRVFLGSQQY